MCFKLIVGTWEPSFEGGIGMCLTQSWGWLLQDRVALAVGKLRPSGKMEEISVAQNGQWTTLELVLTTLPASHPGGSGEDAKVFKAQKFLEDKDDSTLSNFAS